MREVESEHPPGTVGVICGPLLRYRVLLTSLDKLLVPKGTKLIVTENPDIARNRNYMATVAQGSWLWFMDDDHRFNPETLLCLLNRRVDIVTPIVCRRTFPFGTVLFKQANDVDYKGARYSWADLARDHPQGGLITVEAAGAAGMLIQRDVFAHLPEPWFETRQDCSEDLVFCLNARHQGYTIHADMDMVMTHVTPCDLRPERDSEGLWHVMIDIDGDTVGGITYGPKTAIPGGIDNARPIRPEPVLQSEQCHTG